MTAVVEAWSKSGLQSLFGGCSWQWALKKVYGLPDPGTPATALGTAYHAAIELHERVRILQVRDRTPIGLPTYDVLLAYANTVLAKEAGNLPDESWARHDTSRLELGERLGDALTNWWSVEIPDGQPGAGGSLRDRLMSMRPVAVEPYFRVKLDQQARPLHGFIDELLWDPDTGNYVVVDHKTANSFGFWGHGGGGHEIESASYTFGAELARNLPASGQVRMEWHVARKTAGKNARFEGARVVAAEPEPVMKLWLSDHLQAADAMVAAGGYEKNTSWNLCSATWCFAYDKCEGTGEWAPGGAGLPQINQ